MGMGGSIPFIAAFRDAFPDAAILVTGVEDPDTRAHGANEGLHLAEFARVCLAEALLLRQPGRASVTRLARARRLGAVPRRTRPGDGRLTHDLDPQEKGPQDACGVFGVWAPGEDVAKLTYFGLYALQHRGQESAGIAVSNGRQILVYKDMGLVSQAFDESTLESLQGHLAIGHTRYSTTGASTWHNAQPTFRPTANGSIALAHNGNLTNTHDLAERVDNLASVAGELDIPARQSNHVVATNDTSLVTTLLAADPDRTHRGVRARAAAHRARRVLVRLHGRAHAVRRPRPARHPAAGPRPARERLGGRQRGRRAGDRRREGGPRDRARRARRHRRAGLRTHQFAEPAPKGCVFEYVYLARPDATIAGRGVHEARVEMGRRLAKAYPVDADLVIPVPESGTPAAIGYAEASGIPYGQGFVKNAYVGRTFIQPSQTLRQLGIRLKLNPLEHVIRGKRLVVVDDTIVRGNTQRAQIRMLRESGAKEVHVRISAPR